MPTQPSICLVHAALDDNGKEITLRGVLTPESLELLKVADYQREILPGSKAEDIAATLQAGGQVPDITLGMRGGGFVEKNGVFLLDDKVFIIDGLQRTSAALQVLRMKGKPGVAVPRIGAVVHFNTTEGIERHMFRQLNTLRTKLSPNILMYNERFANPQVKLLYDLCQDSSFALYNRVSWKSVISKTQLINAVVLIGTAGELHHHFGVGLSYSYSRVADNLGKMKIPRTAIRDNVKTFWETLDSAFNVREVAYKQFAPHLKRNFLQSLCYVFDRHEDFWEDSVLHVTPQQRKKLATFPLKDPGVATLCSSGGNASTILYPMLIEHLNSGKRLNRLKPFAGPPDKVKQLKLKEE